MQRMPIGETTMRSQKLLGKKYEHLKGKVIALVGIGGTGCTVAQLLSKYPVKLILIDRDIVEKDNLERQILFSEADVGKPKVLAAKVDGEKRFVDLSRETIDFQGVDLVIDCTDNTDTRLLINDYCKKHNIPWLYTGAVGKQGALFLTVGQPCFACFNQEKFGATCAEVGVLNSTVSLVGSLAVAWAIDFLTYRTLTGLLRVNTSTYEMELLSIKSDPHCPACRGDFAYLDGRKGKHICQICTDKFLLHTKKIDLEELEQRLVRDYDVDRNEYSLLVGDILLFAHGAVRIRAHSAAEAKKKFDEVIGM